MYSDYSLLPLHEVLPSKTRSHGSSYSRVAVNFHTWTFVTLLDVAVGHAAT